MNLKTYLRKKCLTPVEFAKLADVCPVTVYKLLKGKRVNIHTTRKIVHITEGAVKSEDILKQNY